MKVIVMFLLTLTFYSCSSYRAQEPNPQQQQTAQETSNAASTSKLRKGPQPVPGRYIVVLNNDVPNAEVRSIAEQLTQTHGGTIIHLYNCAIPSQCGFKGFAVKLSEVGALALSKDARVDYVTADAVSSPLPTPGEPLEQDPLRKFRRTTKAAPNFYLVVLNDDLPRSQVNATANRLARIYGGRIKRFYRGSTKGFLFQTTEMQAIALSQNSQVKYVETSETEK